MGYTNAVTGGAGDWTARTSSKTNHWRATPGRLAHGAPKNSSPRKKRDRVALSVGDCVWILRVRNGSGADAYSSPSVVPGTSGGDYASVEATRRRNVGYAPSNSKL